MYSGEQYRTICNTGQSVSMVLLLLIAVIMEVSNGGSKKSKEMLHNINLGFARKRQKRLELTCTSVALF